MRTIFTIFNISLILVVIFVLLGSGCNEEVIRYVQDNYANPPKYVAQDNDALCYAAAIKSVGDWYGMPIHSTQSDILFYADENRDGFISNSEAYRYLNTHSPPYILFYEEVRGVDKYIEKLAIGTDLGFPSFVPVGQHSHEVVKHIVVQIGYKSKGGVNA